MNQLYILFLVTVAMLRDRVGKLTKNGERGAGGNTLEILLLAVGGVIVATVVVLAVKGSITSRTGQLNPAP